MKIFKNKNLLIILPLFSIIPFLYLFTQIDYSIFSQYPDAFWPQFSLTFASFLGYSGAILIFWQLLLGNRFFVSIFTKNILAVNKVHQNLGKYGTLLIFAHPFLASFGYLLDFFVLIFPYDFGDHTDHIIFGKLAFVIILTIYFTSALVRGKIKFRPWSYFHYLSYPLFALVLLHAIDLGKYWNQYSIIQYFWAALTLAFGLILIQRISAFLGVGKYSLKVQKIEEMKGEILVLTLKFDNLKSFDRNFGQYVYLQSGRGKEAHPFSIMDFDKSSGTLKLGIKKIGKYTISLAKIKVGQNVYLDGPYGVLMLPTVKGQNVSKFFIAGGIGITPFVEYLEKSGDTNAILLNSNKTLPSALFRDKLKKKLGNAYFDFITEETLNEDKNTFCCRLDAKILRENFDISKIKNSQIFICGSTSFNNSIKKIFMDLGVTVDSVNVENFG